MNTNIEVVKQEIGMTDKDPWANIKGGKPRVGDVAEGSMTLTPEKTKAFADISGDHNPLHFDEEAAKRSIFGERIGHGAMMIGAINGVMVQKIPGPGAVMMHADWRFSNPVRVGEEITARVEVLEVRDDKPICKVRTSVIRSDGVICLEGDILTYVSPV
ncbi:MaoC family dehydratase [Rhodococcus opacus]|uniref:MaoC family dehydratase n=1 Tax=Rhodococcus opacus TaxID=37919 RepID=UPI0022356EAC|nr:MaoC family dehydratase [Rhodococcus opacus]UZG60323.1 MaoC family dehydratase [Rhodococcus opacus]